ncbi:olfactory receptor 14C36-like [Cygnus atratus]|uniref:olfactory receptor 14C36-like n=1 Tax=Cygnus atratus TaxID=8868 RepID=UPI0021B71C0E|nr:olfactory receptor 14C36-like [Cygnus atratus]
MAYDRYVAICKPLHYGTIMASRTCVNMAAAAWGSTFLYAVLHTANTFSLPLCQGNALDQFFCELPQILKLSCSDAYLREVGLVVISACLLFGCFVFLVLSYVQIFRAVLRIPSMQGRHKAFSTCLPHLAVVSLFISTVIFAYLKPPSISSPSLNLLLAVVYSVVPPAVNPLIYSMQNRELKAAVRRQIWGMFFTEFYVLTIIAYDRYVAICKPLHYGTIMANRTCVNMAAAAWGILYSVVPSTLNPLIYSMRNQELKDAVWKVITGGFSEAIKCLSFA